MLPSNLIFHARTKYIDIRHHFIREVVEAGLVKLEYLASEKMLADIDQGLTEAKT